MTREPQRRLSASAEAGDELPVALTALGARLRATPGSELRARQLDRAIAAVRPTPTPASRRPAFPRTLRGRAAVAACAAALGLPGIAATLAVAGVKLPEPAVAAFEAIGLTLPNQADEARPARAPDARGDDVGGSAHGADERGRAPATGHSPAPRLPAAPARSAPPTPDAGTGAGVPDSVPSAAGDRPAPSEPAAGDGGGAGPGSPAANQPPAGAAPTELPGAPPQTPESAPAGPATGDRGEPRPAPRDP